MCRRESAPSVVSRCQVQASVEVAPGVSEIGGEEQCALLRSQGPNRGDAIATPRAYRASLASMSAKDEQVCRGHEPKLRVEYTRKATVATSPMGITPCTHRVHQSHHSAMAIQGIQRIAHKRMAKPAPKGAKHNVTPTKGPRMVTAATKLDGQSRVSEPPKGAAHIEDSPQNSILEYNRLPRNLTISDDHGDPSTVRCGKVEHLPGHCTHRHHRLGHERRAAGKTKPATHLS